MTTADDSPPERLQTASPIAESEGFHFQFFAMGTPCSLILFTGDHKEASSVAEEAHNEVVRLERAYSRFLPDSILSGINDVARAADFMDVDEETADLIDHAWWAYNLSDGLFDITSAPLRALWNEGQGEIPDRSDVDALLSRIGMHWLSWERPRLRFLRSDLELDLGGVVKEYAADRAAEVCRRSGACQGLVDLGGDIAIIGAQPDGSPWRIGVRDPFGGEEAVATLFVSKGGVATSGDYERFIEIDGKRFGHILNPLTGWPCSGLASATVVAPSCLVAGAYSTTALLKGGDGSEWLRRVDVDHLCVTAKNEIAGSVFSGSCRGLASG